MKQVTGVYEREEYIMADNDMMTEAVWKNIRAVMGWDIGDGDSVAFIKLLAEKNRKVEPLSLHKSRYIPVEKSVVAKSSNGMIMIGSDAARQKEFIINFKRSPENWDKMTFMGITYRQHMFDYIRGVSEAILQNSANRDGIMKNVIVHDSRGNIHWKKDEVLLVVGCPASVIWKGEKMRKQYEQLISEATGILNVIVTEESRAAVFSLFDIDSLRKKIDLQSGVLVLDFGSSTADATYILPGKKAINISWELGAAQVENAMLRYILQSDKARKSFSNLAKIYGKTRVIIGNDCNQAIFQLRQDKEDYFDGKLGENAAAKSVAIPIMDEDGDRLFDEDGEPAESIDIKYNITNEMIRYALDEYEFDVRKNGQIVNCGTWKKNCQQFLEDVKQALERDRMSVQTVVVTGGGSQMPFIIELCSKAFPEKVVPSDTPSHSVVRGLVTIAYNEVQAPEIRNKVMSDIKSAAEVNIDAMIERIASKLSSEAYDSAVSAVDGLTSYFGEDDELWDKIKRNFDPESNVGEITRVVKKAITSSLNQNVKNQIDNSMKTWIGDDNAAIVCCINEASQQLYADQAISGMIRISQMDVEMLSEKVSIPNISMPDVAKDANFIGTIVGYILSVVLFVVLAFIAAIIPGIGPIFTVVAGSIGSAALIEKLKEWESCPITGGAILKAVKKMKENKNQKTEEIKEPVRKALREAFTKPDAYGKDFEKHYTVLMETSRKAFDKILLKAEDDQ